MFENSIVQRKYLTGQSNNIFRKSARKFFCALKYFSKTILQNSIKIEGINN